MWREFMKWLATLRDQPYCSINLTHLKEGGLGISAVYNSQFIYQLDRIYAKVGSTTYKSTMGDGEKLSIYLGDSVGMITESADEIEIPESPYADAPVMSFRGGGEPIRQVVDIATAKRFGQFDVEQG